MDPAAILYTTWSTSKHTASPILVFVLLDFFILIYNKEQFMETYIEIWHVLGADVTDILQKANINVLRNDICVQEYAGESLLEKGFDGTTMVCAGDQKSNKDTCSVCFPVYHTKYCMTVTSNDGKIFHFIGRFRWTDKLSARTMLIRANGSHLGGQFILRQW